MIIANNKNELIKLGRTLANSYKDCFCYYSTEEYVRGFARRHLNTLIDINKDENNINISSSNQKLFIEEFTKVELDNIETMKKEHNSREKKYIKKNGVKRKTQK